MAYPATFLSLQDAVIGKLRLDSADRPRVKDWINVAYATVCLDSEAFQSNAIVPITPNFASYTLPASVLRIKNIIGSAPGGSYGPPLEEASLDEINGWRQNGTVAATNNGASTRYAVLGLKTLELYPTPTQADSLLIYYVSAPNPLAADGDVPEIPEPFASKLLEAGAILEASEFVGTPDRDYYDAKYERWMIKFRVHLGRKAGPGGGQMRVVNRRPVSVGRDIDLGC